jgi:hypothetical protein
MNFERVYLSSLAVLALLSLAGQTWAGALFMLMTVGAVPLLIVLVIFLSPIVSGLELLRDALLPRNPPPSPPEARHAPAPPDHGRAAQRKPRLPK